MGPVWLLKCPPPPPIAKTVKKITLWLVHVYEKQVIFHGAYFDEVELSKSLV